MYVCTLQYFVEHTLKDIDGFMEPGNNTAHPYDVIAPRARYIPAAKKIEGVELVVYVHRVE